MGDGKAQGEKSKDVKWGGLAKGLMGGAAMCVGVMLVCPGVATSLFSSLGKASGEQGSNWVAKQMGAGIGWLISKAIGIAMVVAGYKALTHDNTQEDSKQAYRRESDEAFTLREDMKKAYTIMKLREQHAGFIPPEIANQMQRG